MDLTEQIVLDPQLCRECGGRCCQGSPGLWVDPQRFFAIFFAGQQLSLETLRDKLPGLGLVFWEKSGVPIPAPVSVMAGCAFWREDGCGFSTEERPCQCLALIPAVQTLKQQGCACRLPKQYHFEQARLAWGEYWRV